MDLFKLWYHDPESVFARLNTSADLHQISALRIELDDSLESIRSAAASKLSHLRLERIFLHHVSVAQQKEVFSSVISKAAQLRSLHMDNLSDNEQCIEELTKALRNTTNLEWLHLATLRRDVVSLALQNFVFDALHTLPLKALKLDFCFADNLLVKNVALLLPRLSATLVFFELSFSWCTASHLMDLMKSLSPLTRLKSLRLRGHPLLFKELEPLLLSLECMPCLRDLDIQPQADNRELQALISFFAQKFRPLTTLYVRFGNMRSVTLLLNVLRKNTRLDTLFIFSTFVWKALESTGMVSEGWLTRVEMANGPPGCEFAEETKRNKLRHEACRRTCVALMILRRKKIFLGNFPEDITKVIAIYLYDMRNKREWDNAVQ